MGDVAPISAMILMECTNVGVKTLYKAANLRGMSHHVFLSYTYAIGALLILPFIFFSNNNRSKAFPPLTFSIITKIGLFTIIGYLTMITGYTGISYSSPTLNLAINSLSPGVTFILALLFRMEKLALRSRSGQAKCLGTVVSIAGALVVTLYKGPTIISAPSSLFISLIDSQPKTSWVIGAIFFTVECILASIYFILLAHVVEVYPAQLTIMLYYNLSGAIQSAVVGFFLERDSSVWRIRPDIALLSILCAGFFSTFLRRVVITWALHLKGPLFVVMFKPLSMVIAVVMGVVFLGDAMYLGSVIGALIIASGFYTVIWGKAQENMDQEIEAPNLESSTIPTTPLLQNYKKQGDTRQ